MNSFPKSFNSNSDMNKLKEEYYMNKFRSKVYKHIITNGKKEKFTFYNLSKEDKEFPHNIEKIIDELSTLGFKHKIMFGGVSLMIYVNDEDASIWLNETLCDI